MVEISQFNDRVNEIKKSFYQLIKHPYLESYIADPEVDEDKIRFLYSMLEQCVPEKEAKMFTISALLVQAALDVHESVTLHEVTADFERKNRQLTILAGDYYSSLYYYLLAEHNHLPLIQVFSHTIQDINEYKMTIYSSRNLPYEEVKENIALIESILFQNIAKHFGQTKWIAVMHDYFYMKRLLVEWTDWQKGKDVPIINALSSEASGIEDVRYLIESKVEDLKDRIFENSRALESCSGLIVEHVDELIKRELIKK
ncbi:heptaprenyl diphosphate synthase component 1 [bacterium LRH843]|nr:heptaprenyl diphosphate synthase component 1 [bacterium LRH843]